MHPTILCDRCKGLDPDCESCLGLGQIPACPEADDGDLVAHAFSSDPDAETDDDRLARAYAARDARGFVDRMVKLITPDDVLGDPEPRECRCLKCGCTDSRACLDRSTRRACHWLRKDRVAGIGICSCCAGAVEAWDNGNRLDGAYPEATPAQIFEGWRLAIPEGLLPRILISFDALETTNIAVMSTGGASKEAVIEVLRDVADMLERQAGLPSQAVPDRTRPFTEET